MGTKAVVRDARDAVEATIFARLAPVWDSEFDDGRLANLVLKVALGKERERYWNRRRENAFARYFTARDGVVESAELERLAADEEFCLDVWDAAWQATRAAEMQINMLFQLLGIEPSRWLTVWAAIHAALDETKPMLNPGGEYILVEGRVFA